MTLEKKGYDSEMNKGNKHISVGGSRTVKGTLDDITLGVTVHEVGLARKRRGYIIQKGRSTRASSISR